MNNQGGFVSIGILLAIILGVAVLGGGTYYVMQQAASPQMPTYQEQTYTPPVTQRVATTQPAQKTPTPASAPTNTNMVESDLKTYNNAVFSIQYPSDRGWVYAVFGNGGVSFGTPASKSGGYIWTVGVSDKNIESLPTLIARVGDQFSDRKEMRENITINGVPALVVTVTTNQVSNWVAKMVYIERGDKIYWMSNGAIDDSAFVNFYNSFKFN